MNQRNKCSHGRNSCPNCSLVKMVVYSNKGAKQVWYSFIKEELSKKFDLEKLSESMFDRFKRSKGVSAVSKILFYENKNVSANPFMDWNGKTT